MWSDRRFFYYSYLENDPGLTPDFSGSPLSISDKPQWVAIVSYSLFIHHLDGGCSPVVDRNTNLVGA